MSHKRTVPTTLLALSLTALSLTTGLASLGLASATPAAAEGANPAAPGFNDAGSDAAAVAIADQVMAELGGRGAWDSTRHITWKFFGQRLHFWDKQTGDIRVEGVERETEIPYTILMNLHSKEGRAWKDGKEVTEAEALAKMIEQGESAWINDSYWLVMPYKLKDSGVTLRMMEDGEMTDGSAAQRLVLTFEEVGRTPENKYIVYVSKESGLVEQWDFFATAEDEEPRFQTPWAGWEKHGEILLSADRGEWKHTDVAVRDELPESVYSDPAAVDMAAVLGTAQGE